MSDLNLLSLSLKSTPLVVSLPPDPESLPSSPAALEAWAGLWEAKIASRPNNLSLSSLEKCYQSCEAHFIIFNE